jgi:hypothetical protein
MLAGSQNHIKPSLHDTMDFEHLVERYKYASLEYEHGNLDECAELAMRLYHNRSILTCIRIKAAILFCYARSDKDPWTSDIFYSDASDMLNTELLADSEDEVSFVTVVLHELKQELEILKKTLDDKKECQRKATCPKKVLQKTPTLLQILTSASLRTGLLLNARS